MLSFSVVINTYNRAPSLRQTLEGLSALDYPLFEIVVVNGPSDDGTDAVLSDYTGRIKIVRLAERNLSISRNLGIAAAAGDIVAFIDDDAYPDPAWLDRLAEGYDRAEIAGVGGPTYDYTGHTLQAHHTVTNRLGESWIKGPESPNPTDLLCRPFSTLYPSLLGTNSSFRRAILRDIGGFDEEFDYYLDETDLCIRLIDAGYVVRALKDGYIYHKFLPSHLRTATRTLRDRYSVIKNRVYFGLTHGAAHMSFYEICADLMRFVERHTNEYRWEVDHGRLTQDDFWKFEADIRRAFAVGYERAQAKAKLTRPAAWFDAHQTPFLRFPHHDAAAKLHIAFLAPGYPAAPAARATHWRAVGLVARGHHVHVLTGGSGQHQVDREDGVWVHRIVPSPHRRPDTPAIPARLWNGAASLHDEVLRIHRHRALDVLEAPLRDFLGIAALIDGTVPVVIDPGEPASADGLASLERFCLGRCRATLPPAAQFRDGDDEAPALDAAETFYRQLAASGETAPAVDRAAMAVGA